MVDDGSTDRTPQIMKSYINKSASFKMLQVEHGGVSAARNKGIEKSKGKYIWFVDADDLVDGTQAFDLAEKIIGTSQKDKDADIVWFSYLAIDEMGGANPELMSDIEKFSIDEGLYNVEDYAKDYFKGAGMLWQYWIKRELLIKHDLQFYEGAAWFEDVHLLQRLFCHAHTIRVFANRLYLYRLNPQGAMQNSLLESRHRCSVMLTTDLFHYVTTLSTPPSLRLRNALLVQMAVSGAWCVRQAAPSYATELYHSLRAAGLFPLKVGGSCKQKIQIIILNLSFRLYRAVFSRT